MNLTLLSKEFPPQLSGIGDHTDHLASELARRGHAVAVVTSQPAEERADIDVHARIERWDARGYDAIARAVAATNPDVILWQYNPFSVGRHGVALGVGKLARGLAGVAPLVVVFHELWFPWGRQGLKGFVWAVTQRYEARRVASSASRCVVTTEQRVEVLKQGCSNIPAGANVLPVSVGDEVRAPFGIGSEAFVVGHLGSIGPGRDLAPAYEAIRRMRAGGVDARLLLAGNTAEAPPAEPWIHTTGTASHETLSRALQAADIYLHPDHAGPSAGRRTTIAAALAHGLPIVSYRGPDAAPQLVDGSNIVLAEGRPDELLSAFSALAAEPDRRRAIGAAARRTYDENFSWTRIGEAFEGVLTDIAR